MIATVNNKTFEGAQFMWFTHNAGVYELPTKNSICGIIYRKAKHNASRIGSCLASIIWNIKRSIYSNRTVTLCGIYIK